MTRALWLLALAGWGCAEPPLGFRVQPSAGLDAHFEAAAATWCAAAGCCPYAIPDGPSTLRYERPGELNAYPPAGRWSDADAIAARQDTGVVEIIVSLTIPDAEIPRVLLHEMGHACGCDVETGDPQDVMHGDRRGASVLSPADIACVRSARSQSQEGT